MSPCPTLSGEILTSARLIERRVIGVPRHRLFPATVPRGIPRLGREPWALAAHQRRESVGVRFEVALELVGLATDFQAFALPHNLGQNRRRLSRAQSARVAPTRVTKRIFLDRVVTRRRMGTTSSDDRA